jgi:hypothetical protein
MELCLDERLVVGLLKSSLGNEPGSDMVSEVIFRLHGFEVHLELLIQ